jgi:hypothetical protein
MSVRFLASSALIVLLWAAPALAMTAEDRSTALDHIADLVRDHYVYKDKAVEIAAEIRALKADPAVTAITEERQLASFLTAKLLPHDRHFGVSWHPVVANPAASAPPDDQSGVDTVLRQANYGFDEVKRLPGNIGYVRMSFFADFDTTLTGDKTPAARKVAEAVLAFLAGSDAVIFDLRRNGGGSPAMIDLLLSGFFDGKVLLNRFYEREGDKTEDFTTLANYSGPRRATVPLYILIGGGTASAAEEFAYDVKTQKRGVLVGEASYGGANPGSEREAGGGFTIFVSYGAAINPITNTNWEGVGVQPDIAAPAEESFTRAYREALKTVIAGPGDSAEARAVSVLEAAKAQPPKTGPLVAYSGDFGDRHITLKDGALYYARDRGLPLKLTALGPDLFGCEEMPSLQLQFAGMRSGRKQTLTLNWRGSSSAVFTRSGG